MKVTKLEVIPVRVAYKRVESRSRINRGGITDVIVKLTAYAPRAVLPRETEQDNASLVVAAGPNSPIGYT